MIKKRGKVTGYMENIRKTNEAALLQICFAYQVKRIFLFLLLTKMPKKRYLLWRSIFNPKIVKQARINLNVKPMGVSRNFLSFAISVPAGIFLLLKGITGPSETYAWLLNYLSSGIIADKLVQSIITTLLLVLIFISSLGGIAVVAGGFLVWKNHVSTGKLLISLGAGIGFFWVIFLVFALVSTGDVFSQYSVIGWTGLILAFVARLMAK